MPRTHAWLSPADARKRFTVSNGRLDELAREGGLAFQWTQHGVTYSADYVATVAAEKKLHKRSPNR
jgi:hypothetical protein